MSPRAFATLTLLLLVCCEWETYEVTSENIQVYVPEERFIALRPGTIAEDVVKAIGEPREKHQGVQERWHYGVWRGETPGVWKFLFRSHIEPATLLEGKVYFASKRVVRVEIVESSAVAFPPQQRRNR